MDPIQLIGGGAIIPLDLTPFADPTARVDPASLPALPAGITLADLTYTMTTLGPDNPLAQALLPEIQIRTVGYLPRYNPEGFDQFGYSRDDKDREGRGRDGLTDAERNLDPLDRPPQGRGHPVYPYREDKPIGREPRYARHGNIDRRQFNKGMFANKSNKQGQIIRAADGSDRTMEQVWFDLLLANELKPPVDRATDEELQAEIVKLFPKRKFRPPGRQSSAVAYARWRYNRGLLPCQDKTLPATISYSYIRVDGVVAKLGARKKCLERWNFKEVYRGRKYRRELEEIQPKTKPQTAEPKPEPKPEPEPEPEPEPQAAEPTTTQTQSE